MAWANGTLGPRPSILAPTSSELTFVPRVAPGSRALLPVCMSQRPGQRTWVDRARAGCWARADPAGGPRVARPEEAAWLLGGIRSVEGPHTDR